MVTLSRSVVSRTIALSADVTRSGWQQPPEPYDGY